MSVQWFDRNTLLRIIRYWIREVDVVLDIGCGIRPQGFFKPKLHLCSEPHGEYVEVLRQKSAEWTNIAVLQATAQEVVKFFPDKSLDSVFMLDVLEHLDKEDGERLIGQCERIARRQIIVFAPLGFVPQEFHPAEKDGWGLHRAVWQTHRSGWRPEDFDVSWSIFASTEFHLTNGKGEPLNPPAGAFWAIKNLDTEGFGQQRKDTLPLVSIVTPAYNRASYLDETIQSVLSQDYPNIEHIVLDDGSTDNTREVLEKYTGRIIWETHPNMGETRTVNKGWSMAHGEIVAVVNSDDPLLPGAVSAAAAFLQTHPDILVAYPDWDFIDPDSNVTGHHQVPEYDYLHMLRRHHCSVGPGAFIRRQAFELAGMRDPEFRYVADFEYWLRLGLYGKFARIPKTLATFRVHRDSASVSHKGQAMAEEHIQLVRKFYSRPDLPPEVLRVRSEAFSWAHWVAGVVAGLDLWVALRHYLRAMTYHPRSFFTDLYRWQAVLSVVLLKPLFKGLVWGWRRVRPILVAARRLLKRSVGESEV